MPKVYWIILGGNPITLHWICIKSANCSWHCLKSFSFCSICSVICMLAMLPVFLFTIAHSCHISSSHCIFSSVFLPCCHVAPFLLTIAHSSRVYSILSEVDGFSFHFFLCSRFKILFSRLKTLFASMLSATAYIAPAALSQNLFDNLRQIIFIKQFWNFNRNI